MPTYDYECSSCHHRVEIFQKITDEPIEKCPACKKKKLVRQFGTGAAIVFKGSGFYQTDYRSESYKKGADSEKPKSDGGSKSDKPEGSTETSKSATNSPSVDSSAKPGKKKPKPE
ncbi:MAG: zinc ribbon domain-containing protein [Pirellulaceae bacterium]|jgi:putative FmdB family regulatory protein|nr:zinc ribbon domain-containing protein [Pirellulaceae bacterium]